MNRAPIIGGFAVMAAIGLSLFFGLHRAQLALRWTVTVGAALGSGALTFFVLRRICQPQASPKPIQRVLAVFSGEEIGYGGHIRHILTKLHLPPDYVHINALEIQSIQRDPSERIIFFYPHVNPRSVDPSVLDKITKVGTRASVIFIALISDKDPVIDFCKEIIGTKLAIAYHAPPSDPDNPDMYPTIERIRSALL